MVGKLGRLWVHADQHTVDGVLRLATRETIDRILGYPGFAEALEAVGWGRAEEEGYRIERFGEHNGASTKKRLLTATRNAGLRRRTGKAETPKRLDRDAGASRKEPPGVSAASRERHLEGASRGRHLEEEEEEEEDKRQKTAPPAPVPVANEDKPAPKAKKAGYDPADWPLPFDSGRFAAAWREWCEYRRGQRKPVTAESAKKGLAELAKFSEGAACDAIDQSIANGWQGLFPREPGRGGRGPAAADRLPTRPGEFAAFGTHNVPADAGGGPDGPADAGENPFGP